jgi:bifunctional non-homologous end joining protein LigD
MLIPQETITLYYREGTSDKVYTAEILPQGQDTFVVNFQYGRRGQALTAGTKTAAPVSLDKAKKIFDKLIAEKTGKGYTPGESGTPYQATSNEDRVTGNVPQLLNAISEEKMLELTADFNYCSQEKHDGVRIMVSRKGSDIVGSNRKGLSRPLPMSVALSIQLLDADCLMDGELVGDTLYVFDILELGKSDLRKLPYKDRLDNLNMVLYGSETQTLQMVATALTYNQKTEMLAELQARNAEGIVFKRLDAPYTPGRPNSGGTQLKFKFIATASCIVGGVNGGKRSVSLLLLNDKKKYIPCGNVTVTPDKDIPKAGDVVEVRYLYAFPDSHILFQPVLLGVREDASPEECVLSQLKYKETET